MQGDVVHTKNHIFQLRKEKEAELELLARPLRRFLNQNKFYPKIFYNENDINHPELGIRQAIPNLDKYSGIFVVQDSPDTPINGFKGIEFRTSLEKSITARNKQLLWTYQDLRHLPTLPPSEYDPKPSVQFVGTIVYLKDGNIFPQQRARLISTTALATSGLLNQTHVLSQQFVEGKFIEVNGTRLDQSDYFNMMTQHPYGLSVRGWGNWDYRFYELLASGRIPVHINTDDVLLFEEEIDYAEHIVLVDDLKKIKEAVETFHSQFTDDRSLRQHQESLVKLYNEYLCFPAFVSRFEKYYGV